MDAQKTYYEVRLAGGWKTLFYSADDARQFFVKLYSDPNANAICKRITLSGSAAISIADKECSRNSGVKTFWTVTAARFGTHPVDVWFDNYTDAKAFANQDYCDPPKCHTYRTPSGIAVARCLVERGANNG